jgi:hypothetical protein
MIREYLHQFFTPYALHPVLPRLVPEDLEADVGRFCLSRQQDRAPATISDVIELLSFKEINIDKFWD